MQKKVLVIDTGLKHLGGHNFSYTSAVQASLEQRGFKVTVLTNKNLTSDLARSSGYHPTFSLGSYDHPPGNGKIRDLIHLYAQSIIFCDELEKAFKEIGGDGYAIVFCHTVRDFELIGWARYLSRRTLPGVLMILQRETPHFRTCQNWKLWAHPYWRIKPRYLNIIKKRLGERFVLLTDSELLTEDYSYIYRSQIVTLPIPINNEILASEPGSSASIESGRLFNLSQSEKVRVGYIGDDRPARGFLMLPDLVKRVLATTKFKTQFVIQCPNVTHYAAARRSNDAATELHSLAEKSTDQIKLISERLSERDYANLIRSLDILVLPYLQSSYVKGTSGVFAEALALSKPVVVSSETWMACELSKSGGGVVFQKGDIDDLTDKVLQTICHREEYASKAHQYSSFWRSFHNPEKLVSIILKECRLN